MEPILTKYIEQRNNRAGQPRAFLVGTRIRVQDIYAQSEVHGKTPEQIAAAYSHISLAQVHVALAYYFDNRESILDEMRQDNEFITLLKSRTGTGPLEQKLSGMEADDKIPLG